MSSDYYVYGYFEPGSEQPFYIGKGRKGRARSHLGLFMRATWGGLFYVRLRELDAKGITPDVRKLHEGMTDQDAKDKEIDLISFWGRIDIGTGCLCNHTRGGDGAAGISAETRAKKSRAAKGRRHSAETRAKIRRSSTGRKHSAESRAKMGVSQTGRKHSAESRELMKEAHAKDAKPVESYDLATGRMIKLYPSVRAPIDDGFHPSNVTAVCKGRQKTYRGLGWRYA